jgi:hypothetical protein
MKMQLDLIILTKIKETIRKCESFGYNSQIALNTVSIDLMHVSVPIENGSQQSSTITHALGGPVLACPLMPIVDQHFRAHFKSYKLLTNNQNNATNKESIHNPNSSTKVTNKK